MPSGTMGAVAGHRPWTVDEEAILRAEWPRGAALPDLAGRLDRSESAIVNRLAKLGITRDSAPMVAGPAPETVLAVAEQHGPAESNGAVDLPTVPLAAGEIRLPATLGDWSLAVELAREPKAPDCGEHPEPAAAIPATEEGPAVLTAITGDILSLVVALNDLAGQLIDKVVIEGGRMAVAAEAAVIEATAPLRAIIDRQAGQLAAYQEALAGRGPVVADGAEMTRLMEQLKDARGERDDALALAKEAQGALETSHTAVLGIEQAFVDAQLRADQFARERDEAWDKLTASISERADLELTLKATTTERDEARAAVAALEAGLADARQEIADLKKVGRLVAGDGVLRSQVQAQRTLIRQLCIMLAVRQDLVPRVEAAKELNMTTDAFRAALERAAQGGQVAVETGGEVKL